MTRPADSVIDFVTDAPVTGSLDVQWIHGARSRRTASEPPIQVHHVDEHTVIMRQSKLTSYEAPFLFLLFGNDRALLLDTGATKEPGKLPLRATVDELIATWLARHPRESYQLVVAHTHGHGDHVAGDVQFARPGTVVVDRDLAAVQHHFGFTTWPDQQVSFDLGGRVLTVIASPGHHRAAISIFDPWTGFLLTGDTVLPGRVYVDDPPQLLSTLETLVAFAGRHQVTSVLGCHIEMTTRPGRDYPLGCTYQPDEPPLQLTVTQLTSVRDAVRSVASRPGRHVFPDFVIFNPTRTAVAKLMMTGLLWKLTHSFGRRSR